MKILVTGKNGQLGKEVCKQLDDLVYEFNAVDIDEIDITNFKAVKELVNKSKPEIIINCAAYTNVDNCEDEEELAFRINAHGARNLSLSANDFGAKIVHISTDYVFQGDNSNPYREYQITDPINVYGLSKEYGERLVQESNPKNFILRTAWLYGDGNNFVKTMLKLSETKDELNVVNDQFGSPTSTVDLAKCIINLMQTEYYGLYHATNEGVCSWYEFAKKIFELKGIDIKVNPVNSENFVRKAKRPKYSVLDNFMLKVVGMNNFRHWEEPLKEYLRTI